MMDNINNGNLLLTEIVNLVGGDVLVARTLLGRVWAVLCASSVEPRHGGRRYEDGFWDGYAAVVRQIEESIK